MSKKVGTTDFVTEIAKHHFLNMTYVDISISDIVSTPESTPGFSTTLNTNLTSKLAFKINQNEFYVDFYGQTVTHC